MMFIMYGENINNNNTIEKEIIELPKNMEEEMLETIIKKQNSTNPTVTKKILCFENCVGRNLKQDLLNIIGAHVCGLDEDSYMKKIDQERDRAAAKYNGQVAKKESNSDNRFAQQVKMSANGAELNNDTFMNCVGEVANMIGGFFQGIDKAVPLPKSHARRVAEERNASLEGLFR